LVQHWQHSSHQVVRIAHFLDLLPFSILLLTNRVHVAHGTCSSLCCFRERIFLNTGFDSLDLDIALLICIFILFDEILRLEDGSVWMDLDNIHVLVLALGDLLASNDITHIHDAILIALIRIIVKEDVLGIVVRLVDK